MALFDSLRATKTRILSHELWLNLINVKLYHKETIKII